MNFVGEVKRVEREGERGEKIGRNFVSSVVSRKTSSPRFTAHQELPKMSIAFVLSPFTFRSPPSACP